MEEQKKKLRLVVTPELVEVNGKMISPRGWSKYTAEEHLIWHLKQPPNNLWCEMDCMAKVMFQRNTLRNRIAVRSRIPGLFKSLLRDRSRLLVVEYEDWDRSKGHRGRIIAVKLFEPAGSKDRQYSQEQLDRMARRMDLSVELRERAMEIINGGMNKGDPDGKEID